MGFLLPCVSKYVFARFLRIVQKETRGDDADPEASQSREVSLNRINWNNIISFDFVGGDPDELFKCFQRMEPLFVAGLDIEMEPAYISIAYFG